MDKLNISTRGYERCLDWATIHSLKLFNCHHVDRHVCQHGVSNVPTISGANSSDVMCVKFDLSTTSYTSLKIGLYTFVRKICWIVNLPRKIIILSQKHTL